MLIRVPESAGTIYERIGYPAGEFQIRLLPQAIQAFFEAKEVTVVCRQAHLHLMELSLLADALFHIKPFVDSTLILPYLPYARADRRFVEADCLGLKAFGEIINQMRFHRVKTLDAHSFRARSYVSNLQDVSARPFITKAIADICDKGGHPVVLLPDKGAKRYELDGALQCRKKRNSATGELSGFEVPEFDKSEALIVDDICDGGGTFIGLAEEINGCKCDNLDCECPTKKLYLYVTHSIFSKGLIPLLEHFERIYTTSSYRTEVERWWSSGAVDKLTVFDCEPVLLPELLGEVK